MNEFTVIKLRKVEERLDEAFTSGDYRSCLRLAKLAAEKQSSHAMSYLGFAYDEGHGVKKNKSKAKAWFERAAELGNCYAQNWLGSFYDTAKKEHRNLGLAKKFYVQSSKNGSASGAYNLAQLLLEIEPKNKGEIVKLWRKAAKIGHHKAQCNLGLAYENGFGVLKDLGKAFECYFLSAIDGDEVAFHNLSLCFSEGKGCVKNKILSDACQAKARALGYTKERKDYISLS